MEAASITVKSNSRQNCDKENARRSVEKPSQAVATYMLMQQSKITIESEEHQTICQPSSSTGFKVSQNDQNCNIPHTFTAQLKAQGPILSKNFAHWLNLNKFTAVSDNNDQFLCGICDVVIYKTALFDHSNIVVHNIKVEKIPPKDDKGNVSLKIDDTMTSEEYAKTELTVGASIIKLPQNIFYRCELCNTWMPDTETCVNAHFNHKRHKCKVVKVEKIVKQKAKREERLNRRLNNQIDMSAKALANTEVIEETMSSEMPSTSREIQDKLCEYCKSFIEEGTALDHANSEFHKKNTNKIIEYEKPKDIVSNEAAPIHKNDENTYNHNYYEIDKPSTSTQPDMIKNRYTDDVTGQAKRITTDIVNTLNDVTNINNPYNHIELFGKHAYCRLCACNIAYKVKAICSHIGEKRHQNLEAQYNKIDHSDTNYFTNTSFKKAYCLLCNDHICNTVKSKNSHVVSKRHKYLETLMKANYIMFISRNLRFYCNICPQIITDHSIFMHIESAVHENAKLEYERNTNPTADRISDTSELTFCTICNNYILISQITSHLKTTHAEMTDIALYDLDQCNNGKYKCKQCKQSFCGIWKSLRHVLGERHLNVFKQAKPKYTLVEDSKSSKGGLPSVMISDDVNQINKDNHTRGNTQTYQEMERTARNNVNKSPEEILCDICKDTILVTQIRKHFKEAHAAIAHILFTEEFPEDFEDKGPNIYRCVQCDILFYGKWNSVTHILGKGHYHLLLQLETENSSVESETPKGDLTKLINSLEIKVSEQHNNTSLFNHMSCVNIKNIQQYDDPFEEIEQDERANIEVTNYEIKTNKRIADDWCDINDVDDYFVFDSKANTSNISKSSDKTLRKYANVMNDRWNYMGLHNECVCQADFDIGQDKVEMGQKSVDANVFELFEKTDKTKELLCKVCRVVVARKDYDVKIHVNGSKHRKFKRLANEVPKLDANIDSVAANVHELFDKSDNSIELFCKICGVIVPSSDCFIDIKTKRLTHVQESKHRKLLAKHEEHLKILEGSKDVSKTLDSKNTIPAAIYNPSTSKLPVVHYVNNSSDIAKNPYFVDKSEKETLCRLCNIVMSNTVAHKKYHLKSKVGTQRRD